MILGPTTGGKNERWIDLCEKAAVEHDGGKLHELIVEIDRLLEEKRQCLRNPDKSRRFHNHRVIPAHRD
jgi:hypothetical protein